MDDSILKNIKSPDDVKILNEEEIHKLSLEIRDFLVENISKTGGHLAPNLGVVELTLALHRVFQSPKDKIIFDVGHQSYVHKLLTGRWDRFHTLRQFEGLSGFPKFSESDHDHFETGHSSTSISAALGMALARDVKKEEGEVVAVIGDGALTGGMSFEALNYAGHNKDCKLIVVLNDNEMSISANVGGLSSYLNRLRTDSKYTKIKGDIQYLLKKVPAIGGKLYKSLERVKGSLKYLLVAGILFEELGFKYLGPIDGHNIHNIEEILQKAKKVKGPVLVHVITKKGKGYLPAEENPDVFHGVGVFDKDTGQVKESSGTSYTSVFTKSILVAAEKDERIITITAAMKNGTGLKEFATKYPHRFFDVGIAEQNAVTMAAGLAKAGLKPVFAVYSTFLQRGYDQVLHDVCLPELPVILAIDRAGIVGADGETHQGIYDIAFLNHIPNMTIISPRNGQQLHQAVITAFKLNSPVAIRYPRDVIPEALVDYTRETIITNKVEKLTDGKDILIVTTGAITDVVLKATETLKQRGVRGTVLHFPFIKPFDKKGLLENTNKQDFTNTLIIEDHVEIGGLTSIVSRIYTEAGIGSKITSLSLPDKFIEHGSRNEILHKYGMSEQGISDKVLEILGLTGDKKYGKENKIRPVVG
ncbi:1-deoxy-D-xylulose-5-phosphate synthase [Alkalicella caledoniensis]|uniref:1-deoxy-D-xylulose-5-phosphate synthase n=1 Tax=Alkalicella caledoniensis TaxID=2731377 RepID=A0A7G9WBV2_ALKCA|nr:1-deoxy-D-xylulose-5-phosphate synthase [Alkalicella caledoniensis]QNO16164.1 1-deoxy-D-xylulose-5-phosphate synthase [Alkalicella caledoniensis]